MLCKTPTFDNVCGIIFFIILLAHLFAIIVPTCWHSCQYVSMMADGIANFFLVGCDRCYCHCISWKPLRCYNDRCFLPMWLIIAIDGIISVADGIATSVMADIITTCGRWNSHFLRWLMLLPLWQME